MLGRYIFRQDVAKSYVEEFERYALDVMYGGNILIGKDIEDEYKDLPAEEGE